MIAMEQKRIEYFDFLRGIAILMVIGIHTFRIYPNGLSMDVAIFIRQILNTAVPLFLAISGYFMVTRVVDIKKKILAIYIPCMIWSVPYMVLSIYHGTNVFKALLITAFCGYSIYYFIALIIQYYILLPFFAKINKLRLCLTGIVSCLCILLITYLMAIKGFKIPLLIYAGPFPVWAIFFAIGCYLGKNPPPSENIRRGLGLS